MRTHALNFRRCVSALAAASALVVLGAQMTPAQAAGAPGVVVRYAGQDLTSDANAQRLLRRIEAAAHEVCADQTLAPLAIQAAAQRCYRAAVAHAVESVNAPRVRAAFVAKYGVRATADEARAQSMPIQLIHRT